MNAHVALSAAQVEVRVEGDRIKLKAPRRPPDQDIELLQANEGGSSSTYTPTTPTGAWMTGRPTMESGWRRLRETARARRQNSSPGWIPLIGGGL